MSIEPFSSNPKYKTIFQIRSEVTKCDVQEVIELYQHKEEKFYVLFRYQIFNNSMPIRMSHKFTDAISIEVLDDGNNSTLVLTSVFKNYLTVFNKVNICCGSKTYVLRVERELYQTLF